MLYFIHVVYRVPSGATAVFSYRARYHDCEWDAMNDAVSECRATRRVAKIINAQVYWTTSQIQQHKD